MSVDLNNVNTQGVFFANPSDWESSHYPLQSAGVLIVLRGSGLNGNIQIFASFGGSIYVRAKWSSSFNSWQGIQTV